MDLLTLPSPQVVEKDRAVKIPKSCLKHLIFAINKKMRIAGKLSCQNILQCRMEILLLPASSADKL